MTRPTRLSHVLVLAGVTAAGLTGCAGKSPAASAPTSAPAGTAPATTSATSPTAPAVDQTIGVTYAGGKVVGGPQIVRVKLNSTVALVVTSDTADEVHFHGYDKHADVGKGGTVRIVFTATLPGRFIAELERLGRRLVTVQVQ